MACLDGNDKAQRGSSLQSASSAQLPKRPSFEKAPKRGPQMYVVWTEIPIFSIKCTYLIIESMFYYHTPPTPTPPSVTGYLSIFDQRPRQDTITWYNRSEKYHTAGDNENEHSDVISFGSLGCHLIQILHLKSK